MRSVLPFATALAIASSGCTAYLKSQNRTQSSRREATQIALGGLSQLLVGSLVTVGGYALYQGADTATPPARDALTASHGGVALVLVGCGLILGGLADGTIALYQGMSGDHLLASSPPPLGGQGRTR